MGLKILKVGGSLITDRLKDYPCVDEKNLDRICEEIATYKGPLILVHGAGNYGHPIVKKTGIHLGIKNEAQKLAFGETQRLQKELNSIVCKKLIEKGVPVFPINASSSAIMENGVLKKMDINVIKGVLDLGMIPVLYGVPAYDVVKGCSILSGDEIVAFLGKKLGAELIIHATDVDGIFSEDPKKNPNAVLFEKITPKLLEEIQLSGSVHTDVTGGMWKKVKHILEVGIPTLIINGLVKGNIEKALNGKSVKGTWIVVSE